MIDGIPNRPLYFYQKDIVVCIWLVIFFSIHPGLIPTFSPKPPLQWGGPRSDIHLLEQRPDSPEGPVDGAGLHEKMMGLVEKRIAFTWNFGNFKCENNL